MRKAFAVSFAALVACAAPIGSAESDAAPPSQPQSDASAPAPDAGAGDASAVLTGAVTIVASASNSGAAQVSFTSAPTGTQDGDWVVAQAVARAATAVTPPDASWTKLADATAGDVYQAIYGKSGASVAGAWSASGSTSLEVTLTTVRGARASTPVAANATATVTDAIDVAVPALSNTQPGELELVFVATNTGPRPWADQGTLLGVIPSGSVPAKWVDQASLHTFEQIVGRKMAYGHSWLPWSFTAFPSTQATGPNGDFAEHRMSVFSWPSELTWPDGAANGNGDPTATLEDIASGKYDALIAANAQVLRAWRQPAWLRPFCEMNGGDHPWEVGHQTSPGIATSGAASSFEKAFVGAWRRLWIITKGTQADATAANMNITTFVHATNVLFHFNPQTYQTTSQVAREALWPGDDYVDAAGTELYMRASGAESTFDEHMTDTSSGNGTHAPLYATYGPGGSLNQARALLGNGEGGNGGNSGSLASMLDKTHGLEVRTAWKFFTYWNGGTSTLDNQSSAAQNDARAFATSAWMSPTLDVTFEAPAGFVSVYQTRFDTGVAGVRYGANQSGSMVVARTLGDASASSVHAYGFGEAIAIAIAVTP
jgi:hypothetical protein